MEWGNLRNWFSGSPREQELRETREAWEGTERLWRASPFGSRTSYEFSNEFMKAACDEAERIPTTPILVAFADAIDDLIRAEDVTALEADWRLIGEDVAAATEVREMLARRRKWCLDFKRMHGILHEHVLGAYRALFAALPESCFSDPDQDAESFEVPLIELLDEPARFIQVLLAIGYGDDAIRHDMFLKYRQALRPNLLVASGQRADDDPERYTGPITAPLEQTGKTPRELAELYLGGTPFAEVLELPVPFHIGDEDRFEHCHIIGGTGHGKTQLMQRMIHTDLIKAQRERRSVVVIDSQGDLINKLIRLRLFDPNAPNSLADRLVIIDPADVEFPAALNLFDAHLERLRSYRPADRERVLNGVIELYEVFFGAMLGAELTQKQGVIFRYLARLMITIPDATIHTLMQLMDEGKRFKTYMDQLEGSARYFFQTEFFHPSFAATKKQILRRLWGVLSTPAFERMFAQRRNKLDLFEALNDGKIIFISTAKDLLKQEGSALFGRFFVAMLAQATQERSTLDPEDRTPTFVYVDEAQEYFDDTIETILNQARKYRVGLTLAHQTLDQLSPRLRSVFNTNTSMKCVGGVSAKDARALADEVRTTPEFIESMRRRGGRTEFAVWLKQMTPHAIRLSVPLGFLERQPLLTEEAFSSIMEANRARYCGTLADVVGFDVAEEASDSVAPEVQPRRQPDARPASPENDEPVPRRSSPLRDDDSEAQPTAPREALVARELGKGGSQHRYVQHLIKGLAEERGFRAVIEEAVEGGQVDVALHRTGLSIACEISVTSKPEYEAQHLAKCLRGGFARVFAVAADAKRLRAIESEARARLSDDDMGRIDFLTPEMVAGVLDDLAAPAEEVSLVRGYRVKVSRTNIGTADAKDRRSAVARVIAQSMRGLSTDE